MPGSRRYLPAVLAVVFTLGQMGCEKNVSRETGKSGQELFLLYCSGCHPNGENTIYPQKSLDRMTLAANGITKPADIVALMRHPGRGMKKFDRNALPDKDALAIAQYVLASFK